ncbi:Glycoside hydrolase, partial [Globisporangium splendens]
MLVVCEQRCDAKFKTPFRALQLELNDDDNGEGGSVVFMQVDMGDRKSIYAFAKRFRERFDRLDLLVNNAGVSVFATKFTSDCLESQFGVNHIGAFYLTRLLFDLLQRAPEARVVAVSNIAHRSANIDFRTVANGDDASWADLRGCANSKMANLLFTYELDRRLRAKRIHNVKTVAAHPELTRTAIFAKLAIDFMPRVLQWVMLEMLFALPFNTIEMGTLPILYAATVESVASGEYYGPSRWGNRLGYPTREISTPASHSDEDAKTLWTLSVELLETKFDVQLSNVHVEDDAALLAYRAQWSVASIPSLKGKIAIVTGANSGIGFETALALARNGAHVVLACRSGLRGTAAQQKIEDTIASVEGRGATEFVHMNLSRLESVHGFVQAFKKKFDRVDILVNNAGLMYPAETHTATGLETQFAVNHLGHFYLTQLLFDLLKKSEHARIVNVSSVAHRMARMDFNTLARSTGNKWLYFIDYSNSKLANLLFTYELNRRIEAAGLSGKILSVAAHPGVTSSDLTPKVVEGYLPTFLHAPLRKLLEWVPVFQSTACGALPSIFAATDPSVKSGDFYGPGGFQSVWGKVPAREISSAASYSEETGAALWKLSEDVANATFTVVA